MLIPRTPRTGAARHPGQAIVEFGLVVVLFALFISGIFDFGVMLNVRLSVSSLSRELARSASLGATAAELDNEGNRTHLLGVNAQTFSGYCCAAGDAVVVTTTYYAYGCAANCADETLAGAQPGDRVQVVVTAAGAEVLTALVRPAFGCTDGTQPHCFIPISATTIMRFEGTNPPAS